MASACFVVSEATLVIVRDEFLLCFFVTAASKILESCVPSDERLLGFVDLLLLASLENDAWSSIATLSSLIVLVMFQDQTYCTETLRAYCANEEDICRTQSETLPAKASSGQMPRSDLVNRFKMERR